MNAVKNIVTGNIIATARLSLNNDFDSNIANMNNINANPKLTIPIRKVME